jgi:hypothetical protein
VPANKQQASVFFVHPSVSLWAIHVLRNEGWQLIRDNPLYSDQQKRKEFFFDDEENVENGLFNMKR